MRRDPDRIEPRSLTQTALWELSREHLAAWAESRSLLEHLDRDEVEVLSKTELVQEIMGALLRAEVYEDRRAFAQDDVARPLEELV